MRGKPRIYGDRLPTRQAPHSRDMRAGKRTRRCRACPARGLPGRPHAGQAPHLRNARFPARGKRRIHGAKERANVSVGAGLARHGGRRECPHAGQAPHLRNARLPAWQAPHSRGKRAVKRPRRCRACPARGSPGRPHAGRAPHLRNAGPGGKAPHPRGTRCSVALRVAAGAWPGTASTRARGRSTRPTHCRALSARHRRRHAHTQA